jgi:hypothetical protein
VTSGRSSSTLLDGPGSLAARRIGYGVTTGLLALLMLVVALDATGGPDILGIDTATEHAEGGDVELEVTYPTVSRPAIASPFDIEVTQPGGFDGSVRIAVQQSYLRMWDENGLVPAPSSETTMGPWVVWEFEPPIGDTLSVSYDARIEPAAQSGRDGAVAVLDEADAVIAEVSFTTRVLP